MQGVTLLVVGMAILFAAMALLILAMVLLDRIFRTRKLIPEEQEPGEVELTSRRSEIEDEEVVAAIAIALAHVRAAEIGRSGLGTALEAGRGGWWTSGRSQQRGR